MNTGLEYLAKEKGFNSLSDVARAMDKTPNVFFSNLRYLLENKSYSSKFAKALLNALDVSEEELRQRMETLVPARKRTGNLAKIIDQKAAALLEHRPSQANDIIEMMDMLEAGDVYTLVTRRMPLEFSNPAFKNVMVAAAARGVVFRYLFPAVEVCEKNDIRLSLNEETFLPKIFEMFAQNLEYLHKKMTDDHSMANKPGSILGNIRMAQSADPILMNPLHAYISIEQSTGNTPACLVLEEISSGKASTIFKVENGVVWYPLTSDAGSYIAEKINLEFEHALAVTSKPAGSRK